jgi:hypothetical protein
MVCDMGDYPSNDEDSEEFDTSLEVFNADSEPDQKEAPTRISNRSKHGYTPNKRALLIRRSIELHRERVALQALIDDSFHDSWLDFDDNPADGDRASPDPSTRR